MKMFKNRSFTFPAFFLLIIICGTLSCDCGDDDDDDSDSTSDDDDDVEPIYNRADHPFETPRYPPDPGVEINGVYFQQITGGEPGENGTSTVVGPDDTVYVAAEKGCLIYLYSFSPGAEDWTREPVAYLATSPSLGIDSEGHLHLAYTDQYEFREKTEYSWNYKLVYATNKSGSWQHEMIDSEGDVGYAPCLVVDENDNMHISYLDAGNEALKYATNRTGAWETQVVLSGGYGGESSLFIDDEGHAHISFTNDEGWYTGVYYATNQDGDWTTITIGSGYRSALVVDHDGAVHIFFERYFGFDTDIVQLGYATNNGGDWTGQILDSSVYSGYFPTAKLREDNAIDVIYQNYNYLTNHGDYYIHYGVANNGTWESQTTFGSNYYRTELSFAKDSEGLFHVVCNEAYRLLKSATLNPQTSEFTSSKIDEGCLISNSSNNIALDKNYRPHVVYMTNLDMREYTTNLSYGHRIDGTWQIQPVDTETYSGYYCSIAMDENNGAHIAYGRKVEISSTKQEYEKYLRYATNKSGQWEIQELADDFRSYPLSIYLDSEGYVHIGYTGEGVEHFTNLTGDWTGDFVDSGGDVGSLFLDDKDHIYMSYATDCGVGYSVFKEGAWSQEYCVENGDILHGNSMVLDSAGYIHLAYSSDENLINGAEFYYATNESGDWENFLVGTSLVSEGIQIKIHVDSQDNLHLLFGSWLNGTDYMTNASGDWLSSPIIPGYSGGSALDDEGYVHAAFQKEGALWYVKFPQGIEN